MTHPHPRISVVVPSQNSAAYIERTLCSVLDQPWDNVELIVVDSGSTDGTEMVAARYADELTWLRRELDTGPAEAINRALAHASGDIVGILPAGNLYLPETLMHVTRRFAEPDAPNWLVSHCLRLGPNDNELGRVEAARPRSLCQFLMHDSGLLPKSGTFYRRELLQAHGPFDSSLRFAFGYEMSARLLAAGHTPVIVGRLLAAKREPGHILDIEQTLRRGREYVDTAMRYADQLALSRRYALWRNCEQRRRIYALAEAEARTDASRRLLWQRLLHHPWWLADSKYRHALLHGTYHPTTPTAPHASSTRRASLPAA